MQTIEASPFMNATLGAGLAFLFGVLLFTIIIQTNRELGLHHHQSSRQWDQMQREQRRISRSNETRQRFSTFATNPEAEPMDDSPVEDSCNDDIGLPPIPEGREFSRQGQGQVRNSLPPRVSARTPATVIEMAPTETRGNANRGVRMMTPPPDYNSLLVRDATRELEQTDNPPSYSECQSKR